MSFLCECSSVDFMVVLVYPKILKKGRCFWVKGIDLFGWLNVSFFRVFFRNMNSLEVSKNHGIR